MTDFVLIPGAWLGGWAWKEVIPELEKKGHKAYPVTLTGMGDRVHLSSRDHGIETAIQDVVNLISYNDLNDFVLVGHSFAGKVAAAVADRLADRIKLIIYLDSFWPKKTREPQGGFDPTSEFGKPPEGGFAIPFSEKIIDAIGPDVVGENRKWMLSRATHFPIKPAAEPITLSAAYDSIRCAHIFCSRSGDPVDEIVQGKWGELHGPHKIIDTGHWPMITRPEELAELLMSLSE